MQAVIINTEKKADMDLIIALAKKLGMNAKTLSRTEIEDWIFAQKIDAGIKSGKGTREQVMKALGR